MADEISELEGLVPDAASVKERIQELHLREAASQLKQVGIFLRDCSDWPAVYKIGFLNSLAIGHLRDKGFLVTRLTESGYKYKIDIAPRGRPLEVVN